MALGNEETVYVPGNIPDTDDPQILKRFIAEELQKVSVTVQELVDRIAALEP